MKLLQTALLALALAATVGAPAHANACACPCCAGAKPAAAAPALPFQTVTMQKTGARLYAMQDGRLPRVWYDLYLEGGERFVPRHLSGMSSLLAEVLEMGPADMTLAEFRKALFHHDAEIRWEATNRYMIAHVKAAPADLAALTHLVRRTIAHPRLDAATFKNVRERTTTLRKALDDDMRSSAFLYNKQKVWDFRPEARMAEGWVASLEAVTAADLTTFVSQRLAHPPAFLAAAGPIPPQTLARALDNAFAGWVRAYTPNRTAMPTTAPGRRVVLIDKPGATDNQIYGLSPLPLNLAGREGAAAEVFFAGMGLDLGARLGKALRVERGLTYYAGSAIRKVEWPCWTVYSFGGVSQTPKIVAGVFELFAGARKGLTAAEIALAKDKLLQEHVAAMETPPEQIEAVAAAVAQGLPATTPYLRPALIRSVTAADVAAVAERAADLDHVTLVVMGDASQLAKPLAAALPAGTAVEVLPFSDMAKEALATPAAK